MAINLNPEEKKTGEANFKHAVGQMASTAVVTEGPASNPTRRKFMQGLLAAGTALPLTAAAYYGYQNFQLKKGPVRVGLIGAGDEGGVLVGEHNPAFIKFVAYSDIRPYNQDRIFTGQPNTPRKGLNAVYGSDARKDIPLYKDYRELLKRPDIEAILIAVPINLHARVAIDAMKAGKHVFCEKLMAADIHQCKEMIRTADREKTPDGQKLVLSIGHQRHYNLLYAHANEIITSGVLGDIRHISAQWHRNMTGNNDYWYSQIRDIDKVLTPTVLAGFAGHWNENEHWESLDQLVRWRLFRKTGGSLMAELGSHQLDACHIFVGKEKHPLAVSAVGGKDYYSKDRYDSSKPDPREIEDHVYCTYEFPGKDFDAELWKRFSRDEHGNARYNDVVTVTYSSISTNGFELYGECVMGSKGTLIVEQEDKAFLFGEGSRSTLVSVSTDAGQATMSTSGTAPSADRRSQQVQASMSGPQSKGYREEMEHFAYVIRNREQNPGLNVRCDGRTALADAIMALCANIAMRNRQRIEFKKEWFDPASDETPETDPRYRWPPPRA